MVLEQLREVSRVKMLHCLKLYLKSISSHSESFWKKILGEKWGGTPILSQFSLILAILKIFTSVLTFFLQKCPNDGLVSFKKYIVFFVTLGGGGGGSDGM